GVQSIRNQNPMSNPRKKVRRRHNEVGAPASGISPDAPDKDLKPGTWTRAHPSRGRLLKGSGWLGKHKFEVPRYFEWLFFTAKTQNQVTGRAWRGHRVRRENEN
ncbi:MAG: hypothetical protein LBM92_09230, partial [Opitutaceae bacterium]|nr:hypothetical protein [Opitutaceae bacterium]